MLTTVWGAINNTYKCEEVVNLRHMKMTVTQSTVSLAVNLPKEKKKNRESFHVFDRMEG